MWCLKVRDIKALEKEFIVKITVEKGQRINRIRIQGPPIEVTSALGKIHHVFHEVTKQEHEQFVGGQVTSHGCLYCVCLNSMFIGGNFTALQTVVLTLA